MKNAATNREGLVYGSVCSGIEAASVAWHPLGWRPAFFAEIAKFPSALLALRWGGITNVGDFTEMHAPSIDLLVGGTPCQSFSVAGLRGGLDCDNGNLALEFLRLAKRSRARWLVWENVPGVLSSNGGRDFGAILGGLVELGYGFAYRVLDAQFFGVPQRRRRVFVVGHLGDWARAAAVLFERACLRWDPPPPRRAEGSEVAGTLGGGTSSRGWNDDLDRSGAFIPVAPEVFGGGSQSQIDTAPCLTNHGGRFDFDTEALAVDRCVLSFDLAQVTSPENRTNPQPGQPAPTLAKDSRPHIAFHTLQDPISGEVSPVLDRKQAGMGLLTPRGLVRRLTPRGLVRRLTPRECERLQGFPDDYTKLDEDTADGPRYRAIGNSMAIPVMRWLGRRIELVDQLEAA